MNTWPNNVLVPPSALSWASGHKHCTEKTNSRRISDSCSVALRNFTLLHSEFQREVNIVTVFHQHSCHNSCWRTWFPFTSFRQLNSLDYRSKQTSILLMSLFSLLPDHFAWHTFHKAPGLSSDPDRSKEHHTNNQFRPLNCNGYGPISSHCYPQAASKRMLNAITPVRAYNTAGTALALLNETLPNKKWFWDFSYRKKENSKVHLLIFQVKQS